jgi:hypothetical protein
MSTKKRSSKTAVKRSSKKAAKKPSAIVERQAGQERLYMNVEPLVYICDHGPHVVRGNPCPVHKIPTRPY